MEFSKFINLVRDRASIATDTEAQTACCATLKVLAERISENKALALSDRVPSEFAECLREEQYGQQFGLKEFYRRVADREGSSPEVAEVHARAVIDVLKQSVPTNEITGILSELPIEYDELFMISRVEVVR